MTQKTPDCALVLSGVSAADPEEQDKDDSGSSNHQIILS